MPNQNQEGPVAGAMMIGLDDVRKAWSPRLGDTDPRHALVLAQNYDRLPPILVHRRTMTVIDGNHRILAARLLGRSVVAAAFFDGSEVDAYVESIRANGTHGKPLSLAERERAAQRVLGFFPEWSDRRIAELCGLSSKTIAGLRRRSTVELPQLSSRVGRDGKRRPCDPAARRRHVARLLEEQPEATVRSLAEQARTSQATVIDVKRRLRQGRSPVPGDSAGGEGEEGRLPAEPIAGDGAVLATPQGRRFATWFEASAISGRAVEEHAAGVPLSRVYEVATEARRRALLWTQFAGLLEGRVRRRRAV